MSYKTILVNVGYGPFPAARVRLAADLADRFGAHLIGFSACNVQPPVAADGMMVNAGLMEQMIRDIENKLGELESDFHDAAGKGRDASWRGHVGPPAFAIAEDARAADLIVTGLPREDDAGVAVSVGVGDLVLDAGRPVVVAADDSERVSAERILVAWTDRREARRAVQDALPLLARAKDVLVATVDDPKSNDVRAGIEDVVAYLGRHGIESRAEVIDSSGGNPGERLVEMATGMDADLVVSGAYGHSRIHEWAFGGVTRSLLASGSINRLMSN